jgi:hypothetical protein
MPILELQKRARELGRIRIGHQVSGETQGGRKYTRPAKLDRFRLTCASRPLLEKVAELYGGTVAEWTPKGGTLQWEVITDSKRIPILVPPQPVSQWLETWSGGGCTHRCDGVTNAITGEPCDPEDVAHQEARPTTRLNVVLRDVEGVGVWRLESHGWNAALELPTAAEFLSKAGGYIDGHLSLEERTSKGINARTGKPETRHFMVPIIEINVTPAELMAGRGSFGPPAVEGPVQAPAIGSAPAALPSGPAAEIPDYAAAARAAGSTEEINDIWRAAKAAGHMTDELFAQLQQAGQDLIARDRQDDVPPASEVEHVEGEVEFDPPDVLWNRCVTRAGVLGWTLPQLQESFAEQTQGLSAVDASAEQLDTFLTFLEQQEAA